MGFLIQGLELFTSSRVLGTDALRDKTGSHTPVAIFYLFGYVFLIIMDSIG